MASQPLQTLTETRVLVSSRGFALLSTFAEELPNTVLVQLFRLPGTPHPAHSLYTVYREGSLTFDATISFKLAESARTMPLGHVLAQFVQSADFNDAVLAPMVRTVREHFGR